MVNYAQNNTQHQSTCLHKGFVRIRKKNGSKTITFEQKTLKNRHRFGLKKIPDGELENFSDFKRQSYMQWSRWSGQEQRKTEKVKNWLNLADPQKPSQLHKSCKTAL